jgi:hypothetical protein
MFSYRSFFSREILGKRRGLSIFCGVSLSLWVECDVVSILSTTVCLFSGGLSIWSSYLPLHSLCYPIYHYIHYVIISWPLLFFQRHTNGHYCGFLHQNRIWGTETILVKRAGEAWLHRWCDDVPSNPLKLQKENDILKQFSSSLVTYLFIIILSILSLFWSRLVIPRSTRVPFDSIIFHVRHISLKSRQVIFH